MILYMARKMNHNLKIKDKVKLNGHIWTVNAVSERYVICTKPTPRHKTTWYTILDFELRIRGAHNYIFNFYNMLLHQDINKCLDDLLSGEIEISHRNRVELEELVIM